MRAVEPWRQMVPLLASWNVMELRRLREMYVIFCECASGRSARANLEVRKLMEPGKIPAEEEILAGRGGSPGRPGGRPWAAGGRPLGGRGGGWAGPWNLPGELEFSPQGASVGGTTLVAPSGPKRSRNRRFPEGAGPAPRPESQPPRATSPELTWRHGTRFRVLLRATLLPDGCPVGVRRQVWNARGG